MHDPTGHSPAAHRHMVVSWGQARFTIDNCATSRLRVTLKRPAARTRRSCRSTTG
jgi:hypothetical protein